MEKQLQATYQAIINKIEGIGEFQRHLLLRGYTTKNELIFYKNDFAITIIENSKRVRRGDITGMEKSGPIIIRLFKPSKKYSGSYVEEYYKGPLIIQQ